MGRPYLGGLGQKSQKKCGRRLWTAPKLYFTYVPIVVKFRMLDYVGNT